MNKITLFLFIIFTLSSLAQATTPFEYTPSGNIAFSGIKDIRAENVDGVDSLLFEFGHALILNLGDTIMNPMASTPDIEDLLKGQITFQLFNDYGLHINLDDRDLEGNRVYSNRADYLTIRHSYAIPRTDLGSHSFAIFPPN